MKRDILCEECEKRAYRNLRPGIEFNTGPVMAVIATTGPVKKCRGDSAEATNILKVYGFALNLYRCDFCDGIIPKETKCVAVSVWVEGRQKYFEWETEFIEPISKSDWDRANVVTKRIMEAFHK